MYINLIHITNVSNINLVQMYKVSQTLFSQSGELHLSALCLSVYQVGGT